MILIEIDNSVCVAKGLTTLQLKELKNELSYVEVGSVYGGFGPQRRFLLSNKGEYPTGLDYLVKKVLLEKKWPYQIKDLRKLPQPLGSILTAKLPYAPYPEQKAAAEAARRFKRGIIVAPTGLGKSAIAALIIQELQVRTLIVVPTLELKRQLTESLRHSFGKANVGSLPENRTIAVENVDALNTSKPLKGYDCVILDEFHHAAARTYRKLNKSCWNGVYYKLGLTATAFRSQDHERLLLESVLSKVIYRIEYETAVAKGYIVPLEAYYFELPKSKTSGHNWSTIYKELVVENEVRNTLILRLLESMTKAGVSTLCLVKEIYHGQRLSFSVPFANGMKDDTGKLIYDFNKGGRSLVATTGVCGEGVDTKPAEYIIIAGLGKSKNQFLQQIGRGFRVYPGKESCKVILFLDKSHRWTKDHFKAQCSYLLELGVTPVKLPLLTKSGS